MLDSTTYSLYTLSDWNALIHEGKKGIDAGYDYYYLNYRLAIAYFNQHSYDSSLKYFEKAFYLNSSEQSLKEYLYWNYFLLDNMKVAGSYYEQLHDSTKAHIEWAKPRLVNAMFFELGYKFSSDKDVVKDAQIYSFGIDMALGKRFSLSQSFQSFIQNGSSWGSQQQYQYSMGILYSAARGVNIHFVFHPVLFQSDIQYSYNENEVNIGKQGIGNLRYDTVRNKQLDITGNLNQFTPLVFLKMDFFKEKVHLSPFVYAYTVFDAPDYTVNRSQEVIVKKFIGGRYISETNTKINISDTYNMNAYRTYFTGGSDLNFKMGKHVFGGASIYILKRDSEIRPLISPHLNIFTGKNSALNFMFIKKGSEIIAMNNGSLLLNNYDELRYRFSATFTKKFNDQSQFFITAMTEKYIETYSLSPIKYNSILTGFKFKL